MDSIINMILVILPSLFRFVLGFFVFEEKGLSISCSFFMVRLFIMVIIHIIIIILSSLCYNGENVISRLLCLKLG